MHIDFKNPNFKYVISGIKYKVVVKALGVLTRNDLSFDEHLNIKCTEAYKVINSIFRCFYFKK